MLYKFISFPVVALNAAAMLAPAPCMASTMQAPGSPAARRIPSPQAGGGVAADVLLVGLQTPVPLRWPEHRR